MKKWYLLLAAACYMPLLAGAQEIAGTWRGTLDLGVMKMALVLHVEQEADGRYVTRMDSPDQGARNIPIARTSFADGRFALADDALRLAYEGELQADSLVGTFRQNGLEVPLTFTRGAVERRRPQEPRPPYPYRVEEVTFPNDRAGITLSGTLTLPQGEGPFPAVVLVSGSGPQNRDEELMGHRPFRVLADGLTRAGIAVLRYDDRGVGGSQGVYGEASLQDFADDAASAMAWLRRQSAVDPQRVGVIGHSEGAMIAYMLAGACGDADFVVAMAGPAVPGREFLAAQRRQIGEAMGVPEEVQRQNDQMNEAMLALCDRYEPAFLAAHADSLAQTLLPPDFRDDPQSLDQIRTGLLQCASPEMRSLIAYDPDDFLPRIACPVLAVVGSRDRQVPPEVVVEPLRESVPASVPLTIEVFEGLNHLFQPCETGLPTEYGTIEVTMAPEVLTTIADWIRTVALP